MKFKRGTNVLIQSMNASAAMAKYFIWERTFTEILIGRLLDKFEDSDLSEDETQLVLRISHGYFMFDGYGTIIEPG